MATGSRHPQGASRSLWSSPCPVCLAMNRKQRRPSGWTCQVNLIVQSYPTAAEREGSLCSAVLWEITHSTHTQRTINSTLNTQNQSPQTNSTDCKLKKDNMTSPMRLSAWPRSSEEHAHQRTSCDVEKQPVLWRQWEKRMELIGPVAGGWGGCVPVTSAVRRESGKTNTARWRTQ